jgi:branched-chain amino acid transport system substrate-binding protein
MFRVLAGLWAGLLLAVAPAAAQSPIVVHHIGPFTGVLASSNQEAMAGARLHLDQVNARGGIGGRPVQLQTLDDGQDPKRSAELLDQLVASKRLLTLLMPRTTPSMEAMMPAVQANGIPVIGPQTGASFINQPAKRELFTLRASYQREAERAIEHQHLVGARRFALLLADDAFGRDTMVGIERAMKTLQIEPVAVARIDNRKSDVTEAVRAIAAGRPEVVLMIVSGKGAAAFVRGYRAQGGNATFVSLSNTSNNDYVTALGDQARGAIVTQILPSPFSATTALARDYAAAAAKAQTPVSYAGMYGFATARLLVQALQRAGRDPTPASLVQALESLGDFDMGGYRLRFGPNDRTGSNFVDTTIITYEGRFLR